MKRSVGILLITLNEAMALSTVCPRLVNTLKALPDVTCLFVDGGSIDDSVEIIKSHGLEYVIQKSPGMRGAIFDGVEILIDKGIDSILFVQPDGNCLIEAIPSIINKYHSNQFDMIIASRYMSSSISEDDTKISKVGNIYFTNLISFFSGYKYSDALVGFRLISCELLNRSGVLNKQKYEVIEKLLRTSLGLDPLISLIAPFLSASILEMPVSEPVRIGGKPKKQTIRWGLGYSIQILYFGIKLKFLKLLKN